MNKLAFALATVATLGLSTAVFAQASNTASPQRVQSARSQTHATHHAKKWHRAGVSKVLVGHDGSPHRGSFSRHYGQKSKKVVIKHAPATKTAKTKAAS